MPNENDPDSLERLQDGATPNRVYNPSLGRMPIEPTAKGAIMPSQEEIPPPPTPRDAGVMEPFVSSGAKSMSEMRKHPQAAESAAASRQSYVLLRVRVAGDRMRILDAHSVEGPLITSSSFAGEHAYEVLLDSQVVAFEGVPDVGVSRSYPRPGEHEHHITERHSFEFTVRIPRAALPDNSLGRAALTLYRFPDASRKTVQGTLARQFGLQAKIVAHLDGLREDAFEPQAREQMKRLFPASVISPE